MINNSLHTDSSSYITAQCPMMYGGQQDDFVRRSEKITIQGLEDVRRAKSEGKDLTQFFNTLLNTFAKERHDIAAFHGTQDAEYFGRSRLEVKVDLTYTPLDEMYREFNGRFISFITGMLKNEIQIKGNLKQTEFTIKENFLNRECSFEIELIDESKFKKFGWGRRFGEVPDKFSDLVMKNLQMFHKQFPGSLDIQTVNEKNYPPTSEEQLILDDYYQCFLSVKKNHPTAYQHEKMHFIFNLLKTEYPQPNLFKAENQREREVKTIKNIYIICKTRIEINKKMYALSEYITCASENHRPDPVEQLKNSTIVIKHQDVYLINDTLEEISKIFERALLWDSNEEELSELINRVGLFRYLFAHAMPFRRGSASIAEWIEKLIYKFHGYHCVHSNKTTGDMEALVAPLWSTFQKEKYTSTIGIIKSDSLSIK